MHRLLDKDLEKMIFLDDHAENEHARTRRYTSLGKQHQQSTAKANLPYQKQLIFSSILTLA